ncbi:MAG: SDR family oxidoreductase [Acidobacteria bacterium]|nr:SDR family oxidoreductase [Acidobacteriota bacterium]
MLNGGKRTGTADEIARTVAFLGSSERSFVSGMELFVDGGQGQIQEPRRRLPVRLDLNGI